MADQFINLRAGLNNVGSYQVSGIPFVTGGISVPVSSSAPLEIAFPSVTKRVIVHVTNTRSVRVGFSSNGVKNSCYFLADGDQANNAAQMFDMNVKCNKIYLLSADGNVPTVSVAAELTGIGGYDLASALSGSAGIG